VTVSLLQGELWKTVLHSLKHSLLREQIV
jgi:hypothetical protein